MASSISKSSSLIRYPAADRNKGPILEVLQRIFSPVNHKAPPANVLEIGSATGQHVTHFASAFPSTTFQPSDMNDELFGNIVGFRAEAGGLSNVNDPIQLDLTWPVAEWPIAPESFDAIYSANVLHISPWATSLGLFGGAGRVLRPGGLLLVYGPFAVNGLLTPESNVQFDQSLRARNPQWGIRDLSELNRLATENGLQFREQFDMPANNKIVMYTKNQ